METIKVGDTIYDIAVDAISKEAVMMEQKVLCVGELSVFASGKCATWGSVYESSFRKANKDSFNREHFVKNPTTTFLWTDNREKAERYVSEMNKILNMMQKLLKAG
ncbi:hypothetical protein ASG01_08970 [Chryseobacterium sp. Leaf180]|uniref:hypothetical protein n=1 Tax=Chryseobacterium sp. Leaf180 TaxID=1736289 RepID=UPI0006F833A1|nr:hypothetical protein [Chryseobacterium sp. Leaf180]KQR93318.1 hypothetical protein ASG01_08970 [Chryseobacterium sp. Leaf180]